jgi:hypothetical protein
MQQVQGSVWLLVVGECASQHVETKSTPILFPTVLDPGNYICTDNHLLQLMDQLLDLGLGAKSWPAIGLHPVHCVGDCDL